MKKRKVVIPVIIIALFGGWYWFRPERLIINRHVDEGFPTSNDSPAQILESGTFHSGTHPTAGTATIYRIENGSRILRFTNFKTSNGPDVHIYMVAAEDARDNASVEHAAFIDLGLIKGNIGDQNYTLGSDVDLAKYRTVSVWCKRFSKNFGAAPLTPHTATLQHLSKNGAGAPQIRMCHFQSKSGRMNLSWKTQWERLTLRMSCTR